MNLVKRIFDFRYIYILGNTRHLFRYKIGISNSIERRTKDINNTVRGEVYEIFAARFFFARKIEHLMHTLYRPLSAKMYGSGKTEWFRMLIPITPTLLLIFIWLLQWILIPILLAGVYYLYRHWGNLF
jgi:hypothetical protein